MCLDLCTDQRFDRLTDWSIQPRPRLDDLGQFGVRAQVRRKRVLAVRPRIAVNPCNAVVFGASCSVHVPVFETGAFNRSATCPERCSIVSEHAGYVNCWVYRADEVWNQQEMLIMLGFGVFGLIAGAFSLWIGVKYRRRAARLEATAKTFEV